MYIGYHDTKAYVLKNQSPCQIYLKLICSRGRKGVTDRYIDSYFWVYVTYEGMNFQRNPFIY